MPDDARHGREAATNRPLEDYVKKTNMFLGVAVALACGVIHSDAHATQQPDYMNGHRYYESAQDPQPRAERSVVHDPSWHVPAWRNFRAIEGGTWYSIWDAQTKVPLRIYGSGIAALGANSAADRAERHARAVLDRHLQLLAPGAHSSDFDVALNDLTNGARTVVFQQHYLGLPVLGSKVSFVFRSDRLVVIGSEALPIAAALDGHVAGTQVQISNDVAEASALAWVRGDFSDKARVVSVEGPAIATVVGDNGSMRSAATLVVTVATLGVPGLWEVYVDMTTGAPVSRRQMLRFGSGTVMYNTPVRWPGAARADYAAVYASTSVDGSMQISDENGMITWVGTNPAAVTLEVQGTYVDLITEQGATYDASGTIMDGGVFIANAAGNEFEDAQITSSLHSNIAKEEARLLNPGLPWLADAIQVTVNKPSDLLGMLFCNAYSDGDTINFFEAFSLPPFIECGNTGRLPDVVYHEFGHSLHAQSLTSGSFDPSLSEGIGDYYAATIQNDPGMGRGFFNTDEPLRDIDPAGMEATWPDDIAEDPHTTGLIFAGAMWDLRTELMGSMGPALGRAHADRLFYAALQQAVDIPSTYPAVLAADDDDGDITNGSPNSCLINQVFGEHGLANPLLGGSQLIEPLQRDGYAVSFLSVDVSGACPPPQVESAELIWQLRGEVGSGGTLTMQRDANLFAAEIPAQGDDLVVQYKVRVVLDNGEFAEFPRNPADPMYEFYVGEPTEIFCTDFENDPFSEGWNSSANSGVDDWAWGAPNGVAGDPTAAYSGNNILGNNLEGGYSPDTVNTITSPDINIEGYPNLRLQYYRWLMVEDGVFDQATISANGTQVWQNTDSMMQFGGLNHVDGEWRFHDVPLTDLTGETNLQLSFGLSTDPGLELGGWAIDDLCVVSYLYCGDGYVSPGEDCDQGAGNSDEAPDACRTSCLAAGCGDSIIDSGETCDNGAGNSDSDADACRSTCQVAACGDGVVDTGEACDDSNAVNGDGCSTLCALDDAEDAGGCCSASGPRAGDALLWCFMLFGLAVLTRRRRRSATEA